MDLNELILLYLIGDGGDTIVYNNDMAQTLKIAGTEMLDGGDHPELIPKLCLINRKQILVCQFSYKTILGKNIRV